MQRCVLSLPPATFQQGYVIHSHVQLAFTQTGSILEMKCERWTERSAALQPTKAVVFLTHFLFFLLLLCDWTVMPGLWPSLQVSSGLRSFLSMRQLSAGWLVGRDLLHSAAGGQAFASHGFSCSQWKSLRSYEEAGVEPRHALWESNPKTFYWVPITAPPRGPTSLSFLFLLLLE